METESVLELALTAVQESTHLDFKSSFDVGNKGDWCEVIKDVVALANSGGGVIVLGCSDDGSKSDWDPTSLRDLDPADISNKLRGYVVGMDDKVEIRWVDRSGIQHPVFLITSARIPRVFLHPGNYHDGPSGRQKSAFSAGTVYFRHGAKSEPADQEDLSSSMERAIDSVRTAWLANIKQVMSAPPDARFEVVLQDVRHVSGGDASPIRIVDDPSAPAFRVIKPDDTHPFRQKEVVTEVNRRLATRKVNSYDVQCIRQSLDGESRPDLFHEPKFGSKQYSEAFVQYIVDGCQAAESFVEEARKVAKDRRSR